MSTYAEPTKAPAAAPSIDQALSQTEPATDPRAAQLKGASFEQGQALLAPGKAEEKAPAKDDKKAEEERLAKIQATWEQSLGKFLGGKLFELLKQHVTVSALDGYAKQGVDAIVKEVPGVAGGVLDDKAQAAAVETFVKALMPELEKLGDKWVESEAGQKILGAISGWVMDHPRTIAISLGAAAIGAAIGAYLSDMKVPELDQTFKLGKGFSANLGAKLGTLQNLAVQAAKVGVSYKAGGLEASLGGETKEDGTWKATAGAKGEAQVKGGTLSAEGKASYDQAGNLTVEVDGGFKTKVLGTPLEVAAGADRKSGDKGAVTTVDGQVAFGEGGDKTTAKGSYNPGDGSFKLSLDKTAMDGALTMGNTYERDAAGATTQGLAGAYKLNDRDALKFKADDGAKGPGSELSFDRKATKDGGLYGGATVGSGTHAGMAGTLGYDKAGFRAQLDMAMKEGIGTAKGAMSYTKGNVTASGSTTLNLTEGRLQEMAGKLGYRDPKEFKAFLIEYKAKYVADNDAYDHEVDVALEYALGKVEARLTGGLDLSAGDVKAANLDLTAGYKLNEDWRLLGSVGYTGDRLGDTGAFKGNMMVGAGVQYKKVAIRATYTPETKAWGVGLTIPFGR